MCSTYLYISFLFLKYLPLGFIPRKNIGKSRKKSQSNFCFFIVIFKLLLLIIAHAYCLHYTLFWSIWESPPPRCKIFILSNKKIELFIHLLLKGKEIFFFAVYIFLFYCIYYFILLYLCFGLFWGNRCPHISLFY